MTGKPTALYVHFPFCVQKCRYCDFLSFASPELIPAYMEALISEVSRTVRQLSQDGRQISSIFIGGGTPSLMSESQLSRLMDSVTDAPLCADAEITIESNPGTLTKDLLTSMRRMGINRLSIGLQSADNEELAALGRVHTFEQFEKNYAAARDAGFSNINIDLMSALPGQTTLSYEQTLSRVLALEPEHISAYSLIIEEDTPFYAYYKLSEDCGFILPPLPNEDSERRMYHRTKQLLAGQGYHRYEISNYARPGYECRHNIVYWRRKDYIGTGLGAASMIENVRFSNTKDIRRYIELMRCGRLDDCREQIEHLSAADQMSEFMFLGLRMTDGISADEFQKTFGQTITAVYGPVIKKHIADGTLIFDRSRRQLYLTDFGLDVSSYVMSDFIID